MGERFSFFSSPFLYRTGNDWDHLKNHEKFTDVTYWNYLGTYIGKTAFIMVMVNERYGNGLAHRSIGSFTQPDI
jgi:hypothetical protein